ncbi:hypothetical protein K1719_036114 [Acacia pycnantha]|nr:hypothetical protein K1719_036114 [Acacia pycnantha]
MANKLINEMGLPKWIANIFAARNIITAKDALSITEFELMELLDVGLAEVTSAIAHISEVVCPPCQTALYLMEHRVQHENLAVCGGIPFGALTELVGPAGIGKTQFCLKLSLLASLPPQYGGLDGRVIYIDAESKFSSKIKPHHAPSNVRNSAAGFEKTTLTTSISGTSTFLLGPVFFVVSGGNGSE